MEFFAVYNGHIPDCYLASLGVAGRAQDIHMCINIPSRRPGRQLESLTLVTPFAFALSR